VSVGGFRSATRSNNMAGVLLGSSYTASRDSARLLASTEEIARWASEQATLLSRSDVRPEAQARCAAIIANLGGDVGALAIGRAGYTWFSSEQVTAWSREKQSVFMIEEDVGDFARRNGVNFNDNVLVVRGGLQFLPQRPWGPSDSWGPVLHAIAKAWNPKRIIAREHVALVSNDQEV